MLTERHLAVIRAALKFWDEEMGPHGDEVFMDYLDPLNRNLDISGSDVRSAWEFLGRVQLRYVPMDSTSGLLLTNKLKSAADIAKTELKSDSKQIVSALVSQPKAD